MHRISSSVMIVMGLLLAVGAWAEPVVVAHRGFSAKAPENTLAAFEAALDAGAPAIELDVHATADQIAVCIHDETVERTTGATGEVGRMACDQLEGLDAGSWKSEEYDGEPIPLLTEALEMMLGRALTVVEIKSAGTADIVRDAIREAGAEDNVVVISFRPAEIERMHEIAPELPTGLLIGADDFPEGTPAQVAAELVARARASHASFLDTSHKPITPELVTELHRRGMALWVYTVDDEARMLELSAMGVDGITTNVPDRALEVLAGR
ncbi:MAG: glycerophosphodiester phosphodiesterase [Armatimonadota bacterium]